MVIDKIWNKFRKSIDKIKKFDYKQYFKTNILFTFFVISNILNATLLRFLTVKNYFVLKPILGDLVFILMLASFAYLLKGKKQFRYYITFSIILTIICIINSVYYTYYTSFASFSLLATSLQLIDVSDAVTKNVMEIKDFIFLWQPVCLIVLHQYLNKINYYKYAVKYEHRKQRMFYNLIISAVFLIVFLLSLTNVEYSRLKKQWNREFLVCKFGVYIYQLNDIFQSLQPKFNTLFGYDNATKVFSEFYNSKEYDTTNNKYTSIFEGKNVIVIHAESIQQMNLDKSFNGEELTPTLNKLAKEGLYFDNFYSQVSVGTSSDTEFTFNTSLMPVNTGTVFVSYWDREYVTIPKLLKEKGYYTFSMHGNNGSYWNRNNMHEQLGYDRYYSKADFTIDEWIGLGLSDKSFFKQAVQKIKTISETNEKYYGTLITLTNHTPFDELDKYGEYDLTMKYVDDDGNEQVAPYLEGTTLGNYFKSVHYSDAALGQFIDDMNKEGLLEDTVIVIYGDHDAKLSKSEYLYYYNYNPKTNAMLDEDDPNFVDVDYYSYELNRKVPFIIWTKDKKINQKVSTVMGMYDALPTLGNMLGIESPYQLGHDVVDMKNNIVVFSNGNWLTNNIYYNSQKGEYKLLKELIVSEEEIEKNKNYANEILEVSSSIIYYDLIEWKESLNEKVQ